MIQDEIFLQGEGDHWLARNKIALSNCNRIDLDPLIRILDLMSIVPTNVLEIGASNGYRLHEIHRRRQCSVTAVEPSEEAIQDGKSKFPAVRFFRGTAAALPLNPGEQFDLVIVNFVLSWIDRSTLLRSIAEIDRVLQNGGYLMIGDFYPALPQRVRYHHLPGQDMWTYKQNYADIFLASNLYEMIGFFPFDHSSLDMRADVVPPDRTQVVMLRKQQHERYQIVETPR